MKRRNLIKATALVGSALAIGCGPQRELAKTSIFNKNTSLLDKVNHSACRWCYNEIRVTLKKWGVIKLKSIVLCHENDNKRGPFTIYARRSIRSF